MDNNSNNIVPRIGLGTYNMDSKEAEDLSNDGYTGMKMKIGALSLLEDSIRVKEVKNTIGDNIRLMFDANEAYDSSNALEFLKLVNREIIKTCRAAFMSNSCVFSPVETISSSTGTF